MKPMKISLVILAVSFLSLVASEYQGVAGRLEITLISNIMIFGLLANICNSERIYMKLIKVILGVSLCVSVFAIMQNVKFILTGSSFLDRGALNVYESLGGYVFKSHALFASSIILGHYLLFPSVAGMYIWPHLGRSKFSFMVKASTVLSSFALIITFSRGAWVAFAMAIIYLLYDMAKSLNKLTRRLVRLSIIAVIIISIVPAAVWALKAGGPERALSTVNRLGILIGSAHSISENPYIGRGLGSYVKPAYTSLFYDVAQENKPENKELDVNIREKGGGRGRQTHNTFLEVAVDLGLIGLALYLYFLYNIWHRTSASLNACNGTLTSHWVRAILAAFFFCTVCTVFFSGFLLKQTWVVAAVVLAGSRIKQTCGDLSRTRPE
jgi:O-antigen ligase